MSDLHALRVRRQVLSTQLAALNKQHDAAFRANSDALALQRVGLTHHNESEMNAFAADEAIGDSAITDLRRRIELIDDELAQSGRGIGQRARKLVRHLKR